MPVLKCRIDDTVGKDLKMNNQPRLKWGHKYSITVTGHFAGLVWNNLEGLLKKYVLHFKIFVLLESVKRNLQPFGG